MQVTLELCGDKGGEVAAGIALGGFAKERGQVLPHNAVEQRPFGLLALVAKCRIGGAVRGDRRIRCEGEHRVLPITSRAMVNHPSLCGGISLPLVLTFRPALRTPSGAPDRVRRTRHFGRVHPDRLDWQVAANQLRISARWLRRVRTTFLIGSSRERIATLHHWSRKRAVSIGPRISANDCSRS